MNLPQLPFLSHEIAGNSIQAWLIAVAIVVAGMAVLRLVLAVLRSRLPRPAPGEVNLGIRAVAADIVHAARAFLLGLPLVLPARATLDLAASVDVWVGSVAIIALIIQIGLWIDALFGTWLSDYRRRHDVEEAGERVTTLHAITFVFRLVLWSLVLLVALDNIPGVNVTTLVASLGVGGIAVALAMQNILADLFASLTITLDKPFVIGDFIIVGDFLGTVQQIGLKTTRIQSLSGEQLIFSNNDLLSSRIRNYGRMKERRIVFGFGVVYQTPADKLERIPDLVREIVGGLDQVRLDRVHFKAFGDFSLNFEVVYYVEVPDYNVYMDKQQAINLALARRFEAEAIEFAYPTQTLFVNRLQGAGEAAGEAEN